MDNTSKMNLFKAPERPSVDDPNQAEPDVKDRTERIADKLANKAGQQEHKFDEHQKPFNK